LIKTSSTLGEEEVFSSGARSRFGLFDTPCRTKMPIRSTYLACGGGGALIKRLNNTNLLNNAVEVTNIIGVMPIILCVPTCWFQSPSECSHKRQQQNAVYAAFVCNRKR
jgi:hypothetical protein